MHVANRDLSGKWVGLVRSNALEHRHQDGELDIRYGVTEGPQGYKFEVSGTDNGQAVVESDFFQEQDVGLLPGDWLPCFGKQLYFKKQFNRVRRLRQGGHGRKPGRQDDLPAGAEDCGFYCQDPGNPKSLLVRPLAATVTKDDLSALHYSWKVVPNLMPCEPNGHYLVVPSDNSSELPHLTQTLTPLLLQDLLNLCEASKDVMIFFNSLHAGATQNHFHLHLVYRHRLAIDDVELVPLGQGSVQRTGSAYPITALVYGIGDGEELTDRVMKLQARGTPLNLVYLDGKFFLFPRDINNEVVREFPGVVASMELCGRIITADRETYDKTTGGRIRVALGRLALAIEGM